MILGWIFYYEFVLELTSYRRISHVSTRETKKYLYHHRPDYSKTCLSWALALLSRPNSTQRPAVKTIGSG